MDQPLLAQGGQGGVLLGAAAVARPAQPQVDQVEMVAAEPAQVLLDLRAQLRRAACPALLARADLGRDQQIVRVRRQRRADQLGGVAPLAGADLRDLRVALERLNPDLPDRAIGEAIRDLTVYDVSRSMVQQNRDFYRMIRNGVPVTYRDAEGRQKSARARVIDFDNLPGANRFLAVRELKLTGIRTPNYNRRVDLICFVNGLPLVFIELKAVYKNIRAGFDGNLRDYMDENVIAARDRSGDTWSYFHGWGERIAPCSDPAEAAAVLGRVLTARRSN